MRDNGRKRKKTFNTERLFILLGIAAMFLISHPSLQPVRDSWIFTVLCKAVLTGVVLFFTWIWDKKSSIFEKVVLSILGISPWLVQIMKSDKNFWLFHMMLLLVLGIILLKSLVLNKKCSTVTWIVALFLAMRMLLATDRYTYLHNSRGIHFWVAGLIAAVLAAAVCVFWLVKKKIRLKKDCISERTAVSVATFGAAFVLTISTLGNLNYALDHSIPVRSRTTILEKDIRSGSKRPTKYVLIVNVNNEELDFYVSQSEYYRLDVGDTIFLQLYQGALGHEYYIW